MVKPFSLGCLALHISFGEKAAPVRSGESGGHRSNVKIVLRDGEVGKGPDNGNSLSARQSQSLKCASL